MIYISLEISVTDIVHTQYLGNIVAPRRLLSAGYQPWEGNAGRAAGVRCWNLEMQPSSSRPPDEDTNPLGQLLKGHFFLCICHLKPDKTCQKTTNPCPAAILLQDGPDFTWHGWVWAPVPRPAHWWEQCGWAVTQDSAPFPAAPAPNTGGKIVPHTSVVSPELSRGFGHRY